MSDPATPESPEPSAEDKFKDFDTQELMVELFRRHQYGVIALRAVDTKDCYGNVIFQRTGHMCEGIGLIETARRLLLNSLGEGTDEEGLYKL